MKGIEDTPENQSLTVLFRDQWLVNVPLLSLTRNLPNFMWTTEIYNSRSFSATNAQKICVRLLSHFVEEMATPPSSPPLFLGWNVTVVLSPLSPFGKSHALEML